MPRYANDTDVSVDRTISQLKQLIERFGASQFALATAETNAMVGFRYNKRAVKFELVLPSRDLEEFHKTETGRKRKNPDAAILAWERACRSQWRALYLLIKALFVAIESGLVDFDRAFMHDIVTPNGKTVGQLLLANVQDMVESGKPAPLSLPFTK